MLALPDHAASPSQGWFLSHPLILPHWITQILTPASVFDHTMLSHVKESPKPVRHNHFCSHKNQTRSKLQKFALALCLFTGANLNLKVEVHWNILFSFVHSILYVIDQLLLGARKANPEQHTKTNRRREMSCWFAALAWGGTGAGVYKQGCLGGINIINHL